MEEEDDGTGIPKHAAVFKIKLEIEHINIENYVIKMNFIDPDNPDQIKTIMTPLID